MCAIYIRSTTVDAFPISDTYHDLKQKPSLALRKGYLYLFIHVLYINIIDEKFLRAARLGDVAELKK